MTPILGIIASSQFVSKGSYESIATAVGAGTGATISFTSIPSTFKHLQVRWIAKDIFTTATGVYESGIQINGDTGSNYASHNLVGNGSTATASGNSSVGNMSKISAVMSSNASLANMMGVGILDILDYASTTKTKTIRSFAGGDTNSTTGQVFLQSGLWNSTSAVTSITFLVALTGYATTTQFALYGIKG
jgi:hypothetical protein